MTLRHLECNEETRDLVHDQVRNAFGHFEDSREMEVSLVVSTVAPRTEFHGPTYDCRIVVRAPWVHKELFVHEEADDFFEAVHDALRMMHRQLVKVVHKQISVRRHFKVRANGSLDSEWMEDLDEDTIQRSTGS